MIESMERDPDAASPEERRLHELAFLHDIAQLATLARDWDELMEVNLKGLFFCAQAAARGMIARGYGRIVNMSSQASVVDEDIEATEMLFDTRHALLDRRHAAHVHRHDERAWQR